MCVFNLDLNTVSEQLLVTSMSTTKTKINKAKRRPNGKATVLCP